jgi:hypothetical protein
VVVTTSVRSEETIQAPAVTICPKAKDRSTFPGWEFTPEDITAATKGEFLEILCKEDGDISRCIEDKTFNVSLVKYFTKDGIQGEHISDIQYWIPDFTTISAGMCFTLKSPFPMESKVGGALRMELDNKTNYLVFIHDPDFFFLSINPWNPFNIRDLLSSETEKILLYNMIVVEHHKLDRASHRCNQDLIPTFTSCIKESFSKAVGCRLPWDRWSDQGRRLCRTTQEFRSWCLLALL